ncbi:MAG: hypothetical protein M1829_006338 [Trizodia sp. TS-e1964]|nr:MAG: hypothetical protein M1829_006338 [Trizodia sp. TS-e1964]
MARPKAAQPGRILLKNSPEIAYEAHPDCELPAAEHVIVNCELDEAFMRKLVKLNRRHVTFEVEYEQAEKLTVYSSDINFSSFIMCNVDTSFRDRSRIHEHYIFDHAAGKASYVGNSIQLFSTWYGSNINDPATKILLHSYGAIRQAQLDKHAIRDAREREHMLTMPLLPVKPKSRRMSGLEARLPKVPVWAGPDRLGPRKGRPVLMPTPTTPPKALVLTAAEENFVKEQERQKNQIANIRRSIIHLLAVREWTIDDLIEHLGAARHIIDEAFFKVAKTGETGRMKNISDRAFKDLDPWNFDYPSEADRELAIQNAISAFDRMRVGRTDPLWQILLPVKERGKGILLSRLELQFGPYNPHTHPRRSPGRRDSASASASEPMSRTGSQSSADGAIALPTLPKRVTPAKKTRAKPKDRMTKAQRDEAVALHNAKFSKNDKTPGIAEAEKVTEITTTKKKPAAPRKKVVRKTTVTKPPAATTKAATTAKGKKRALEVEEDSETEEPPTSRKRRVSDPEAKAAMADYMANTPAYQLKPAYKSTASPKKPSHLGRAAVAQSPAAAGALKRKADVASVQPATKRHQPSPPTTDSSPNMENNTGLTAQQARFLEKSEAFLAQHADYVVLYQKVAANPASTPEDIKMVTDLHYKLAAMKAELSAAAPSAA